MQKKIAWIGGAFAATQVIPGAFVASGENFLAGVWPLFGVRWQDGTATELLWVFDPSFLVIESLLLTWRAGVILMLLATGLLAILAAGDGIRAPRTRLVFQRIAAVVWSIGVLAFLATAHVLAFMAGIVWFYSAISVPLLLAGSFLAVRTLWFPSAPSRTGTRIHQARLIYNWTDVASGSPKATRRETSRRP